MQMAKIWGLAQPIVPGCPTFGAHRSDDRRRDGELRHARRSEHRGAQSAHRLRRNSRVIEQTIRQKLPEGFQRSEFRSTKAC
jgi:hypothetical protein